MAGGEAKFSVGQLVRHQLFGYRGVVVDVDATFQLSDEWYAEMARSRPPKDQPWYHVLVHDAVHATYVAERNLSPDASGEAIRHPLLDQYFTSFEYGRYATASRVNEQLNFEGRSLTSRDGPRFLTSGSRDGTRFSTLLVSAWGRSLLGS